MYFIGELRERAAKEKAQITPARPAPPPPSKTDSINASKKTSKLVQSPAEASQAKPASKPTPPNQVRAELEAQGTEDEAREVENKVYMFDTESESEEEDTGADIRLVNHGEPSRERKTTVVKEQSVDEIEMSMKNMGKLYENIEVTSLNFTVYCVQLLI